MAGVTDKLQKIAEQLNGKGLGGAADKLTELSQVASDKDAGDRVEAAADLIASDYEMLETAFSEVNAANQEIEAAGKRKKKWIKGIDLKKGKFTEYCKAQGFDGPCKACAEKALKSDDPGVRGMASFYLATKKFKKNKK